MTPDDHYRALVMIVSVLITLFSYWLICRKEGSWINWATPSFVFIVAAEYVFQFAYLFLFSGEGSEYAYTYCYATYAATNLAGAVVFCFVKPIDLSAIKLRARSDSGQVAWLLLFLGFLLYAPILIEFRQYLLQPREIYSHTRIGYGLTYFGSTTLADMAICLYLFRQRKRAFFAIFFYFLCFLLIYLHGSKGQLFTPLFMMLLFRVYVNRRKISARMAVLILTAVSVFGVVSFAAYGSFQNVAEILEYMTQYSDYTRNAMMVIDDPQGRTYYGRLALESLIYPHIPRAVISDKPKDFGPLKLAKVYFPASYREEAGLPAFGIGEQYSDFGAFAILILCIESAATAWLASSMIAFLRTNRHPSVFMLVLFLANMPFIPAGTGYWLPETMVLALGIAFLLRFNWLPSNLVRNFLVLD
jgi:oligosaccharide repeat unit polymerase